MKIHQLKLRAFGPYKQEQVLDFTSLNEKQLFLVTGPTGSGKTTLFDAIAYALYGKSSGNGREGEDFVSQHASIEDQTMVELTFELKGQTYTIKRSPKQIRPKARGEGTTVKNAEATLTAEGHVFTSIAEINVKMEEILGIDAQQFRQIVMLPQGEFRQLLEANSTEKEQIFRKIFKTDFYKQFQDQLHVKVKDMESSIRDYKKELLDNVRNLDVKDYEDLLTEIQKEEPNYQEVIEGLRVYNQNTEKRREDLAKEIVDLKEKREDLIHQLNEARNFNDKYDQLSKDQEAYIKLLERKAIIQEKSMKIEQFTEAKFVREMEDLYLKTLDKHQHVELELKQAKDAVLQWDEKREQQGDELREAYANYQELDGLKQELQSKMEQRLKVKEWNEKFKQVATLERVVKTYEAQKEHMDKELTELDVNQSKLSEVLEERQARVNENQSVSVQTLQQKSRVDALKGLEELLLEIEQLKERHCKLSEDYLNEEAIVRKHENVYQANYQTYLKSQAGILALELKENEPCPVCGSTDHPHKAELAIEVKSREALEEERQKVQKLQTKVMEHYNQVRMVHERMKERIERFNTTGEDIILDTIEQLETTMNVIEERHENEVSVLNQLLKKEEQFKKDQRAILDTKQELKMLHDMRVIKKENLVQIVNDIQKATQTYLVEKGQLEQLETTYQLSQVNQDALEEAIIELKNQIKVIDERYHRIQEEYNTTMQKLSSLKSAVLSLESQSKDLKEEVSEYRDTFALRLKNAQFKDESEYKDILKLTDAIPIMVEEVRKYQEETHFLKKQIEHLVKEIGDQERNDLGPIEENIKSNETTIEDLNEQDKKLFATYTQNTRYLDKICRTYERINRRIEDFNHLAFLDKVTNGQNSHKLSFERYVLTAYFDEIIACANLRLREMTERRYTLIRDDEYTGGRGGQGLDILVYDSYTNKKRSVKTLSGGESFMASLSLALGLADVVSSYAGGIQLDTIFIDEGFGTLDPVALDHAIVTLNSLKKSGRTVGIISHVQELRERIDSQIEIMKSKEGSLARIRL